VGWGVETRGALAGWRGLLLRLIVTTFAAGKIARAVKRILFLGLGVASTMNGFGMAASTWLLSVDRRHRQMLTQEKDAAGGPPDQSPGTMSRGVVVVEKPALLSDFVV
jgi:hypothetical protein